MVLQELMSLAVLIIFALCMGFIFVYSLVQLSLIINYLRSRKSSKHESAKEIKEEEDLPIVTIQLPVYNELYVVERLIECVCEFDYPKSKLEIQVLDDSTDESIEVIAKKVHVYQLLGFDIQHVRRPERIGYKAGALKYGTARCKGEFIAIFDADFLPNADFLRKALPYFENNRIGVVQSKWEYTNEDYSFLTKVQAFGLNAHFSIEQVGRNFGDHFINFNGTAGIWRKTCIEDAGGWQADTLTEDLDLSYRAQLKNWKFIYREELGSPSELPVEINALKAQQFRWTKGAAECVKKNLFKVLRSKNVSFKTKVHASFHLMNSSIFFCILTLSLLTLPLILVKPLFPQYDFILKLSAIFMISWAILAVFYWVSYSYGQKNKLKLLMSFIWKFPLFLSISMGLGLHNALAVFEGYIGKKSAFVRTPKFNIKDKSDKWENNKYNVKKVGIHTYVEGLLFLYFVFSFKIAIEYSDFGMMPLLVFLMVGYGIVFFSSILHWKRSSKTVSYGQAF
ncbi:MAG: cellulose synthase/poly-beta-1,6-N-acetylglucosamine synthase-like glycosyltransferase [Arenicella sp.]|jgi:cellulose synthase/poly-beta-1,6-N-acetylglucosamine synthase-like glycosyltransferase